VAILVKWSTAMAARQGKKARDFTHLLQAVAVPLVRQGDAGARAALAGREGKREGADGGAVW
jgi:hypothetical protein